jgi:hypothetical protein
MQNLESYVDFLSYFRHMIHSFNHSQDLSNIQPVQTLVIYYTAFEGKVDRRGNV